MSSTALPKSPRTLWAFIATVSSPAKANISEMSAGGSGPLRAENRSLNDSLEYAPSETASRYSRFRAKCARSSPILLPTRSKRCQKKGVLRIRASRAATRGFSGAMVFASHFSTMAPGSLQRTVRKIFKPFYTTKKDIGTGSGLWLSPRDWWKNTMAHYACGAVWNQGKPGLRFLFSCLKVL